MILGRLVDRVRRRQAEGITTVVVPSLDTGSTSVAFTPNEVYLEVRIRQMWLTDERELWREFTPFATVVSEFSRNGGLVSVPTVLGAATLGQGLAGGVDDGLEVCNVRVAGPVPYEGDDVSLLIALFRMKKTDWIARSLKLVEDVAGALGFAGLAATTPVAASLVRGVESFLDLSDLELRVGAYQSWSAPNGGLATTGLQPMDFVVLRRPVTNAGEPADLRVKDGRLHRVVGGELVPYREHDFILIGVEAREFRDDYRALDFYGLWRQTQRHVIDGDLSVAQRLWRQTAGAIFTDDLTRPQQEKLFAEYQRRYLDLVDRFTADAQRGTRLAPIEPAEDDDPETILRGAAG